MSNPLSLRIQDAEIRQQRIETDVLYPISVDDTFATGGFCRFILKHRGFLHPDSRLIIPAVCSGTDFQYAPTGGVFSLIKTATLRVGGQVISQVDNANLLMAQMNLLRPMEHREKVDAALHGVNSSWETGSGAKSQRSANLGAGALINDSGAAFGNVNYERQMLAGQMRIVGSVPYKEKVLYDGINPNRDTDEGIKYVESRKHPSYKLTTSSTTTPQFMISLQQLFPGFMGQSLELPVALIDPNDQIEIELYFTDNNAWGSNQRAILNKDCSTAGGGSVGGVVVQAVATTMGTNYNIGDILTTRALVNGNPPKDADLYEVVMTAGGAANAALTANSLKIIDGGSGHATAPGTALINVKVSNATAANGQITRTVSNDIEAYNLGKYQAIMDADTNGRGPVRIVADKVRLLADYIYYEDGTEEAKRKAMMSATGLQMPYTIYRNLTTTLPAPATPAVGTSSSVKFSRQVGLANEVVRQLTMQLTPTGNLDNTAATVEAYGGYDCKNQLLLDYHSLDSQVENGNTIQYLINSIPYFPAPVSHSQHQFVLHKECFESPLHIPEGVWNAFTSCKQRDDELTTTANNKQPGFTTDYSNTEATRRYEFNNRKAGVANQLFEGHSQQKAIGCGKYLGTSFKLQDGANVSGNGIKIGNLPVVLELTREFTNHHQHNKSLVMNVFAECERMFALRNGFIQVSGASY